MRVRVCMYVCMYVQVYVYLYVLYTCMNPKKSYEVITKSNGGSHLSKNNLLCVYVCVCMCLCMHACVLACMR